ncbi:MAG: hypothetical protein ACI33J_00685 [Clostridium sp.]
MKIFKIISSIIVMFFLVTFIPQEYRADEKVKLNVTYGIDGKFKGVNLPINVEVENTTGSNIEGNIEVRTQISYEYYDSYVVEVNLSANEKRTVTIPVNLSGDISSLKVLFNQDDSILTQEKLTIGSGRVNDYSIFMGILTDDYNGNLLKDINVSEENGVYQVPIDYKILKTINSYRSFQADDIKNVSLNKDIISNSNNLESLDVIVINNYNTSNLTEDEYLSLKSWVDKGGTLIIGTGENSSKTIGNINKKFFDIASKGTKDSNGYTLADLEFQGETEVLKDETPIIYKKKMGLGNLYAVAYDFGNSNIASEEILKYYWKEALSDDFDKKFSISGIDDYDYNKLELVNQIPSTNMYKTSTLALVFLIYVLLVGIILYLVFKKLNKREYLWVAIPVTAILFCVLFFAMGTKTRVKDVVLNQVTFLTKDKDGTNNNTVYVGITSKYNKDLLVKNPEEGNLELINDEGHYYSSNDEESKNSKIRTKIIYNGSNTSYEYKDLPALNMKTFKVNNVDKTLPDIQANLSYNGGELKGTIKNTLGYDIKSLIILSQNGIWNYGEVKEGEEINTENNKASKIKDIYGGMYSFIEDENRLSGRIRTILYSLTDTMYSGNGIKIVAITEIPMDYKFDFGNRKISKFDTTVIVQDGNLNIADENGNCSLPFDYFTPEVSSSQGDVYFEENMINGTGDVYLEYTIDSNIDVNKLTIGYIKEDENYYYQEDLKGKLYIVNRTKNDFEEIDYLESGVVLSNPKDYLTEDNKLYIRLECNDEMNVSCPRIAVEGVVNNVEN